MSLCKRGFGNVWAWTALGMLGLEGFGQKGFGKVWAWTALVGLKVQARKDFGMLGAGFCFGGGRCLQQVLCIFATWIFPTSNMDIPNMDIPNMDIPNMDIPNMYIPNMDIPNMDIPNMDIQPQETQGTRGCVLPKT